MHFSKLYIRRTAAGSTHVSAAQAGPPTAVMTQQPQKDHPDLSLDAEVASEFGEGALSLVPRQSSRPSEMKKKESGIG